MIHQMVKVRELQETYGAVNIASMDTRFKQVVTREAELRALLGQPSEKVLTKVRAVLDERAEAYIEACPFVLIASSDAQGRMDISPKGDEPGFVHILNESTLAIRDRAGNRRGDTFTNVVGRRDVALLFMIPGRGETLRLSGRAEIVRDTWLLDALAADGAASGLALVIHISELFFHCPKCMMHSKLWDSREATCAT
jgi:PPOX class probable FMN-dependent enzyme